MGSSQTASDWCHHSHHNVNKFAVDLCNWISKQTEQTSSKPRPFRFSAVLLCIFSKEILHATKAIAKEIQEFRPSVECLRVYFGDPQWDPPCTCLPHKYGYSQLQLSQVLVMSETWAQKRLVQIRCCLRADHNIHCQCSKAKQRICHKNE